jgi:hypothetical protein
MKPCCGQPSLASTTDGPRIRTPTGIWCAAVSAGVAICFGARSTLARPTPPCAIGVNCVDTKLCNQTSASSHVYKRLAVRAG